MNNFFDESQTNKMNGMFLSLFCGRTYKLFACMNDKQEFSLEFSQPLLL